MYSITLEVSVLTGGTNLNYSTLQFLQYHLLQNNFFQTFFSALMKPWQHYHAATVYDTTYLTLCSLLLLPYSLQNAQLQLLAHLSQLVLLSGQFIDDPFTRANSSLTDNLQAKTSVQTTALTVSVCKRRENKGTCMCLITWHLIVFCANENLCTKNWQAESAVCVYVIACGSDREKAWMHLHFDTGTLTNHPTPNIEANLLCTQTRKVIYSPLQKH